MFSQKVDFDPVQKIWRGPRNQPVFNPKIGLGELLLRVLERTPKKVTQISANSGIQVTCEQLRLKAIRVAENLRVKYRLTSSDIVTLVSRNNENVSAIVLGCLVAGVPINTLDPTFERDDLAHMFKFCPPTVVFCEKSNVNSVLEALGTRKAHIILFEPFNSLKSVHDLFAPVENEATYLPPVISNTSTHTAVILCSSGTTGFSKGVALSHAHLICQLEPVWTATQNDVMLSFSSLYWISGFGMLVFGTLSGATRVITTDKYEPELALSIIERYGVTTILSPPSQIAQALPFVKPGQLDTMRWWLCGGSYVANSLRMEMQKHIPNGQVAVAYGMTEAAGLTHIGTEMGSVGKPRNLVDVKIVDEDGRSVGPKDRGEICIHMEYRFLGYQGCPELSSETIDSDGWIHTGDLGFCDEEGNLFIVDRMKDIIKYMGTQISPSDIESAIQRLTGLKELCVVGIEDLKQGTDLPAVLVVRKDDLWTEEKVLRVVEENLPSYKHLRGGCYFVEKLPMTPSGKIQRRLAKVLAAEMHKESLQ